MRNSNNLDSNRSPCPEGQVSYFLTLHILFYWVLFGQIIILLLSILGYEIMWPVIDWVSSIVPSVESLKHSEKVMNNDLARAHYALMWLFSPALIIAMLFSPVRQGEREYFIRTPSLFKAIFGIFIFLLIAIFIYFKLPDSPRATLGLGKFSIGFALISSFYSSFIAIPFRYIKLIFTDTTEGL